MLGTTLSGCTSENPSAPSVKDVTALLARHGRAVLAHDRVSFLSGVDAARPAAGFRRAQAAEFANLAKLPLAHWSYAVAARTEDRSAEAAATKRYGRPAVIVRITLTYALRDADTAPTRHDLFWTFVRRGGRVVAAGDDGLAAVGGTSWRGPWDFGPLLVARGRTSLVLGHSDPAALTSVAATVDAAVPAVSAVWGTRWTRFVAVIVPGSPDELSSAVGEGTQVTSTVAAAAVSDTTDPVTGVVLGPRLIVNPDALRRLTAVGRRIVIRHEVTHIAAGRDTAASTPRWLVEGFAEYVANLGTGQPIKVAAAELHADVAAGRVPDRLPADGAFDAARTSPQAYQQAWLACELIAEKVGAGGLVRFYRLVGAEPTAPDVAIAAALRSVLHESPGRFSAQWRAYLARVLR